MIAGRYVIGKSFASGGVGTIHLGRLCGAGGFSRVVAIKRLFPTHAADEDFREMLLREGRLASRIRHPNVVPTLDVVQTDKDVYVVMEYVHGVALSRLLKREPREPMPVPIAIGILEGVLHGLHAAHEARGEDGIALGIVHRDVSPQNILIGADGIARVIDFGIAKASTQHPVTQPGIIKGKAAYMAPEQLRSEPVSRSADVFATTAVLWEMLAGRPLIGELPGNRLLARMTVGESVPPSRYREGLDPRLDRVVLRGLALKPSDRFPTAEAMVAALRETCAPARSAEIAKWLEEEAADELELSEERMRLMERSSKEPSPSSAPAVVVPRAGSRAEETRRIDSRPPDSRRRASDARTPAKAVRVRPHWSRHVARFSVALAIGVLALLAIRTGMHRAAPPLARVTARPADLPPLDQVPQTVPSAIASEAPMVEMDPPPAPSVSSAPSAPAYERAVRGSPSVSKTRAARPAGNKRCDPPYTIDASGRKHYDPACF